MWEKIPEEDRRRYNTIIFVALPLIFVISYFVSIKITTLLDYQLDLKGLFVVGFSYIPLYIMSVIVAYRKLRRKGDQKEHEVGKNRG
jgi:Na+/glutamate symporter